MPESACAYRIDAGEFREAAEYHVRELRPCAYCFPDGEIDVAREHLVVSEGRYGRRRCVHRDARTGPLDYDQGGHHGPKLGRILRRDDVTSVEDAMAVLGGESDG